MKRYYGYTSCFIGHSVLQMAGNFCVSSEELPYIQMESNYRLYFHPLYYI